MKRGGIIAVCVAVVAIICGFMLQSPEVILYPSAPANWIIVGDTVRTDNAPWGELSAKPHTLHGPGYVYCNATMAADYGNIDFVWGFNTSSERPRSIELYNPRWVNTTSSQFFQNVSNICIPNQSWNCDIGHAYNTYKRAVTYERCSEHNETTWDCEAYEQVTHVVCFDSYENEGNNYTITWHNAKMKYWTDILPKIDVIEYNWQDMNYWRTVQNVSMPANVTKTVRIWIDMPVTLGSGNNTKFFFAAKRTTDTIQEAIAADRFMALDPWHNTSRSHRKLINITHVNSSGSDLTNFTVFVNVTKESEMQSDFDDILFYETDGTVMSFEYENHTTDYSLFWTLVPTLTAASDTQFYMYYGNGAASSPSNPEATWNANYSMVQHLQEAAVNDSAGDHVDSTSNNNDGTAKNFDGTATSTTDGTGKIDGADVFAVSENYIDCGAGASLHQSDDFTYEAWVKFRSLSANQVIIEKGWYYGDPRNHLGYSLSSDAIRIVCNNATISQSASYSGVATDVWYHITCGRDTNNILFMYVNGTKATSSSIITGDIDKTAYPIYLGRFKIGASDLQGTLDDVRISNVARSADWINQSYQLVANQSTYVTFGAEENLISVAANKRTLFCNWSANTTFVSIAANLTNCTDFFYYNSTSQRWSFYNINRTINANTVILEHAAIFVHFNASTNIICDALTAETITIPANAYYYTPLRESTAKTLSQINTAITADGCIITDLYAWNSTLGAYTNTGSYSVPPNGGVAIYATTGCSWDGAV